jgi:hypothetical protein
MVVSIISPTSGVAREESPGKVALLMGQKEDVLGVPDPSQKACLSMPLG